MNINRATLAVSNISMKEDEDVASLPSSIIIIISIRNINMNRYNVSNVLFSEGNESIVQIGLENTYTFNIYSCL